MITDMMKFFAQCGMWLLRSELFEMHNYLYRMIKDGRVIEIRDEKGRIAIVCVSMCDDPEDYIDKEEWEYLPHQPNGSIAFIEHMACKSFTKKMCMMIHDVIIERFPTTQRGMWRRFRLPKDKTYTLWRKSYATQQN